MGWGMEEEKQIYTFNVVSGTPLTKLKRTFKHT
jgi:hypothetical protein